MKFIQLDGQLVNLDTVVSISKGTDFNIKDKVPIYTIGFCVLTCYPTVYAPKALTFKDEEERDARFDIIRSNIDLNS